MPFFLDLPPSHTTVGEEDVTAWPYSVCGILGLVGVSYLELLLLCEHWAGERLIYEKPVSWVSRSGRRVSNHVAPVSLRVEKWMSCRFLGNVLRSFRDLPGGIRWFLP